MRHVLRRRFGHTRRPLPVSKVLDYMLMYGMWMPIDLMRQFDISRGAPRRLSGSLKPFQRIVLGRNDRPRLRQFSRGLDR